MMDETLRRRLETAHLNGRILITGDEAEAILRAIDGVPEHKAVVAAPETKAAPAPEKTMPRRRGIMRR